MKHGASYRKRGLDDELDEDAFADFYLAMAQEFLERSGEAAPDGGRYEARLPPKARARFRAVRRCSFSWLTDRTTLTFAALLAEERVGVVPLRLAVLAQLVFTDAAVLEALGPAAAEEDVSDGRVVARALRDFFAAEALATGRPPRRSPISRSLQTGALCCLGRSRGCIVDKAAAFVERLGPTSLRAYARIAKDGDAAAAVLQEELQLPAFRAHCVARLLWVHSAGAHGASPDSHYLGVGALDALRRLVGDDAASLELGFRAALPRWRAAVLRRDDSGVVSRLEALGLLPFAAQTFEHLLCEAGKVFGLGPRPRRGAARPGYAPLWARARRFFAHPERARVATELQGQHRRQVARTKKEREKSLAPARALPP